MNSTKQLSPVFQRRIEMCIEALICLVVGFAASNALPWDWSPSTKGLVAVGAVLLVFLLIFRFRHPSFFRVYLTEDSETEPATSLSRCSLELEGADKSADLEVRAEERSIAGRTKKKVYQVPKRFGLRSIIFLTLVFALLSMALRGWNVSTVGSLLAFGFVGVVALAQILMEASPRLASTAAGAAWMTIYTIVSPALARAGELELFVFLVLQGAILGYVVGVCLGGLQLLASALEHWWRQPAQP